MDTLPALLITLAIVGLMFGPALALLVALIVSDHGSGTGLDPCATRPTCSRRD